MKILQIPDEKLPRIFYIALLSLAGALIGLLAIGSIIAIARSPDAAPLFTLGKAGITETAMPETHNDDIRIFSGLGRLRIPLFNSSILILSIAFPYSAGDTAFTEELAAKIGEFRAIAHDYFISLPVDKQIHLDEDTAKAEILRRFNAALRLGRIEVLYFSDMMVIDAAPQ